MRPYFLILESLYLSRLAQQIHHKPLKDLILEIYSVDLILYPKGLDMAMRAVQSAGSFARRHWGWTDSCLTRSLVLANLIKHQGEVSLHIGFRKQSELEGHAWLSLNGRKIEPAVPEQADIPYQQIWSYKLG